MNGFSKYIENGWPALLVMAGPIVVLLFLRFIVPVVIQRYQRKKPLTKDDV